MTSNPPRLFLAQEPRGAGIDLAPLHAYADEHGYEVSFVYSQNFNLSQHPSEAALVAESWAAHYDYARDAVTMAGGDPLAGMFIGIALAREAIESGAKSFTSLRYVRNKDETGKRTIPMYLPIEVPLGVR